MIGVDEGELAAQAVRVLNRGPRSTRQLLEGLAANSDLDVVESLHRFGRSRGFGQCADGLWRLAADSDELTELFNEDRGTPSHDAFLALRRQSGGASHNFEGWDIDTPLLAYRSLLAIESRHRAELDNLSKPASRAIEYLLSVGLDHQAVEQVLYGAEPLEGGEISDLDRSRRHAQAATDSFIRVRERVVSELLEHGLSLREVAARTGESLSGIARLAKRRSSR